MSKSAVTYLKREYKKVLPVFVLSLLFIGLIFMKVYARLRDADLQAMLSFAYSDSGTFFELGDSFIGTLTEILGEIQKLFLLVFECLLIQRVFYQENRAGVSDFLRILPIRESHKVCMKVLAGESVIFGFCAVFGIAGSLTYAVLEPQMAEASAFFYGTLPSTNLYGMLWQMTLLLFLGMTAIFLVLFVARLCIHNRLLATAVGAGILFVPVFYSYVYEVITGAGRYNVREVAMSLLNPLPNVSMIATEGYSEDIQVQVARWGNYPDKLLFLLVVVGIALAVLTFTLIHRWNVQESNNVVINSPGVAEFIICGFSMSAGFGWNFITGAYWYGMAGKHFYMYFLSSFIVGAIVWAVIHGVAYGIMKRQKGA